MKTWVKNSGLNDIGLKNSCLKIWIRSIKNIALNFDLFFLKRYIMIYRYLQEFDYFSGMMDLITMTMMDQKMKKKKRNEKVTVRNHESSKIFS